jgi:hypothetical protein
MRNWIGPVALVLLLAPLSAHAGPRPGTSSTPLLLTPSVATNPALGAQAPTASAPVTSPQVQGFLDFLQSNGTARQLGKVCSVSCRQCVATCPPGEGFCIRGGC